MREYDLIADWYAAERRGETGVPEVVELARSLPPRSRVLDLGCGTGIPITRALQGEGHRVVGIDTSPAMLRWFQRNCPAAPAVRGTVLELPFATGSFDAAVAWGVVFHLPQPDQITAIASVARVLRSGAPFLFTAGDVDSAEPHRGAPMHGIDFFYYSYTVADYERILARNGFAFAGYHADQGGNGYYLAHRLP
jgi:SAM-dependent methyltransferase